MNKTYKQCFKCLQAIFLICGFLLLGNALHAQSGPSASGMVKDTLGVPIVGATVKAENKLTGKATNATTDVNGVFNISNLQTGGNYSFTFTFIGFETKTLTGYQALAGNKISLSVTLKESATSLTQVVVTGYGTSRKADLTGAITSVQAEDFNRGVISSPAQLLQGKVPGFNITRSGNPNDRGSILLRGPSTLRAGAQEPFYVIDGVPGASIDLLAPDDIMSIDVLKDASSTAIYGARAANGVIMVTTRKAKPGQSSLSYSGYGAVENVSNQIAVLGGDELRSYLQANNRTLNLVDNNAGANTDWQKELTQTSISNNHNVSLNGNSGQTAYNVSLNYLNNKGIIKTSGLERFILRANIDQKFFDNRLRLNVSGVNSVTSSRNIAREVYQNMLTYLPTVNVRQPDGSYTENFTRTRGYLNPVSLIDNNIYNSRVKTFLGNAIAEARLFTGLKYTLSISYQDEQNYNDSYNNRFSGLAQGLNGYARRQSWTNNKKIIESYFNYDKRFGNHDLKLLAGYSWQEDERNNGFGTSNQNFVNDNLTYNNLTLGNAPAGAVINYSVDDPILGGTNPPIAILRIISFYGRAQYNYKDKYLFQTSLRRDGSSAFGANSRWGYFPSVSAAWNISNEDFMKGVSFVNNLKLRAGWGSSGNSDGIRPFTTLLLYGVTTGSRFYYNGSYINPIGPRQNQNPDLKWETTDVANIGVDFSLFNNILSGSVDVYDKRTKDLINDYQVSTTQYYLPFLTANGGNIRNKGIEAIVSVRPLVGKALKWTSTVNVAYNKNTVESLSSNLFQLDYQRTAYLGGKGQSANPSQILQTGLPLGSFLLARYAGKDAQGVSQFYKADGSISTTPPVVADFAYVGNAQPKLIYGWGNTFTYKNVDLGFFVRGVLGNKVLNATLANLNSPSDATNVNIPRFTLNESPNDNNAYILSDRYLESGSYLRLDNATLGYNIPLKVKSINRLRIYATGNNLFLITKYRGIDPEMNMGGVTPGIDNNNFYPKTRSFLLGLNVTF
ncbi:SusC/RagA family TonB-linked outer membrane protein [Mucilaginibacter aquatilis]|uniref:SusC/RagA family TonB-linked outer membrane protein n=1 Tax=Mucilaginibacter aquatilis TaxID=1517760 RepID=A0A6I4IEC9_9SPHI|nr:SusC/RagA family TonB-linked outer membrane protein [Mucilaginibacter aquatilis]MVN91986.1 SusC/RagA family TonB-linked outer membrane protein [Mucilaginibacter aquatilis]